MQTCDCTYTKGKSSSRRSLLYQVHITAFHLSSISSVAMTDLLGVIYLLTMGDCAHVGSRYKWHFFPWPNDLITNTRLVISPLLVRLPPPPKFLKNSIWYWCYSRSKVPDKSHSGPFPTTKCKCYRSLLKTLLDSIQYSQISNTLYRSISFCQHQDANLTDASIRSFVF